MSALFDVPHPAMQGSRPVLWFGVIDTFSDGGSGYRALIANGDGAIVVVPLESVTANVRYSEDRANDAPTLNLTGPGWVDLEDMGPAPAVDAASISKAIAGDAAQTTARPGVIYDSAGLPYDSETGQPLDE